MTAIVDELVKTALIGTGRAAAAPLPPVADGPLGEALASLAATEPEARLLSATAVAAAYEACGRVPSPADPLPPAAAPDARPAPSPRAAELLEQVLAMSNTPTKMALVDEWLALADAAGRRVPHRSLPALLDYGATNRAPRARITVTVDARGAWLMAMNPRWQFGVAEHVDAAAVWSTGNAEQRAAVLRQLRETDPTAARALVQSTWAEDGADERAAFIGALAVSLSADDEPFLESALDDRSKQVRTAAVDLLARLPASAFVARMTDRAGAMLSFTAGKKGGLLKKAKPAAIEVTLPAAFDKDWARDGVVEKVGAGKGQRQGWLQQVVAMVPPAHWSRAWSAAPADLVTAAAATDYADVLLGAWTDAAVRSPDVAWSEALLMHAATADAKHRGPLRVELLNALPPAARPPLVAKLLAVPDLDVNHLIEIVASTESQLDAPSTTAVLAKVAAVVKGGRNGYDYRVTGLLDGLALRIAPSLHDELAGRWTGPEWEPNRKALDAFLQTLQIRRDVRESMRSRETG